MEDTLVLLHSGKINVFVASRRESTSLNDDSFCYENFALESEIVSHLLGNRKLLPRRKIVVVATLDAILYSKSARKFSKILDGRRDTAQGS